MKTIEGILFNVYGVGPMVFNTTVILWASDRAADAVGVEAARAELRVLNGKREKRGLPPACHAYGHRLF